MLHFRFVNTPAPVTSSPSIIGDAIKVFVQKHFRRGNSGSPRANRRQQGRRIRVAVSAAAVDLLVSSGLFSLLVGLALLEESPCLGPNSCTKASLGRFGFRRAGRTGSAHRPGSKRGPHGSDRFGVTAVVAHRTGRAPIAANILGAGSGSGRGRGPIVQSWLAPAPSRWR